MYRTIKSVNRIEAKTGERMKMGKVPWYVGRDAVVVGVGRGWEKKVKKKHKNMLYGGAGDILHYFKYIRQGALQSDYVMFFGGALQST